MTFNSTTMLAVLKTLFPKGAVKEQIYPRHPFFGLVNKDPSFSGVNKAIPVVYSGTSGASATFATAVANKGGSNMVQFLLTTVEDYATVSVTRKVMLQTRDDKGARLKAVEHAHKMGLYSVGRSLSNSLFRDGEGIIGAISSGSTVASTSITLADINDVVNFEKGMEIVASTAAGGALRTGSATVTGVNRSTGVLTTDSNWSTQITSLATTDFLYRQGDARNNGSTKLKMVGLAGWLPTTAPSGGESFFGVDRSVDSRLYGTYYDASTLPVEEALIEAQSRINRESLGVDLMLCNPAFKRLIQKALGSKVNYLRGEKKASDANVSFQTVKIDGDKGPIDIVADPDCPFLDRAALTKSIGYFLRTDSWTLHSMLEAPHIFDEGSAQMDLREASADSYEGRVGAYAQFGPAENDSGPGDNGVAHLPIS